MHDCDLIVAMEHIRPGVKLLIDKLKSSRDPIAVQKGLVDRDLAHSARLHSEGQVVRVTAVEAKIAHSFAKLLENLYASIQFLVDVVCTA
jgi:hypothetical protein